MQVGTPAQVEGYLRSAGYRLLNNTAGFIVADKPELGGDRHTLLVCLPSHLFPGRHFPQFEAALVDRIDDETAKYPEAKCTILVQSLEGIGRPFRELASSRGLNIRVPVQFFDAPFRVEESTEAVSAIKALRDSLDLRRRIQQPFVQDGVNNNGIDLLSHLRAEIKTAVEPCIRFVVGSAGAGKSVLFNSLFSVLYRDFLDAKARLEMSPRPIPLIPEHLRNTYMIRTPALMESFLRSDVAAPVSRETLEWMLTNSCCFWMFDGLDELYSGDPDFFDYILELMTRPGSNAQLLVCARDSLLSSNDAFMQFMRAFSSDEAAIQVYRLKDWDNSAKRAFAWTQLEGRTPRSPTEESPKVDTFLNWLNASKSTRALSGLPYYCSLLLDRYADGQASLINNQFDLLEEVVSGIRDREIQKGTIRPDMFELGGLDELLETIASGFCLSNYSGTSTEDIRIYTDLVLHHPISDDERQNLLTSLVQFPLFISTDRPGVVSFKHELLAEYLFGKQLAKSIKSSQPRPLRSLDKLAGRPLLKDTLSFQYLVEVASRDTALRANLMGELCDEAPPDKLFRVLLQLWISSGLPPLMMPRRDILEGRDLSGIGFRGMDLMEVSFRGANLTDASFSECQMGGSKFEGAHLVGTVFGRLNSGALRGAQFGNFEHFQYIYWGTRRIEDRGDVKSWATEQTGIPEVRADPCPTTLQIRGLFGKFVRDDGVARRDELPRNALVRGRVYDGAATAEDCIECCIRRGYLRPPDYRERIKRATGESYNEIVRFMRVWSVNAGIKDVLDELCPIRGCKHLP